MTKTNYLTNQKQLTVTYGADTSGCPIECLSDLIRKCAHQRFEERGCQPGRELEDWFQAEREIKKRLKV